jgi:Protein of unknown function (DUF1688)
MLKIFKRSKSKDLLSDKSAAKSGNGNHFNQKSTGGTKSRMSDGNGNPASPGGLKTANTASSNATAVKVTPAKPPPDPKVDPVGYLRSLNAVRERSAVVMEKAKKNELLHFDVDWDKMNQTVKWVLGIIKVLSLS